VRLQLDLASKPNCLPTVLKYLPNSLNKQKIIILYHWIYKNPSIVIGATFTFTSAIFGTKCFPNLNV